MKIRVIGLGNVFMGDDGFGPAVARTLEAFYELPPGVDVIDGGVPGFSLTPHLATPDPLILVHAAPGEGTPGEIRIRRASDAGHAPGVAEVLSIGVVPEWVATGVTLSRHVRSAIAPVVGVIVTELERVGVPLVLRATPRQPDFWWDTLPTRSREIFRAGCGL